MKILHAITKYPPGIGGQEKLVRDIALAQAGQKHDVAVVTSDLRRHFRPVERMRTIADDGPVRVTRLTGGGLRFLSFPYVFGMRAAVAAADFDVAHVHCCWQHPALVAARTVRKRKKPLVVSPIFHNRTAFPRTGPLWRLYLNYVWPTFNKADRIILATEQEHAEFRAAGLTVNNMEILPPSVDVAEFDRTDVPDFYGRFGLPPGARKVLLVGRVGLNKGVDLLIRAAAIIEKEIGNVHFFVVGPADSEGVDFEAMAQDCGVGGIFHFHYAADRAELVSAFKNADLFVLPSRYETFGLVLAEAMSARIPVIGMRTAAIPYVIDDGVTGLLFENEDWRDLAKKAVAVLADASLAQNLAQKGRAAAEKKYSQDKYVARLIEIYREVS